jgi:hypothetical protein
MFGVCVQRGKKEHQPFLPDGGRDYGQNCHPSMSGKTGAICHSSAALACSQKAASVPWLPEKLEKIIILQNCFCLLSKMTLYM